MSINVVSWACNYFDGLVRVTHWTMEVGSRTMGIVKPSKIDFDKLNENEGIILDARLLERVFKTPIFNIKRIPLKCRLSFSQALKDVLFIVVAKLGSVGVWVRLLLLPRFTL